MYRSHLNTCADNELSLLEKITNFSYENYTQPQHINKCFTETNNLIMKTVASNKASNVECSITSVIVFKAPCLSLQVEQSFHTRRRFQRHEWSVPAVNDEHCQQASSTDREFALCS